MTISHSNKVPCDINERINELEAKIDRVLDILASATSTQPLYTIKQAAADIGCSCYLLKEIWKNCSPDVPEPVRGARYSKRDINTLKEAYVRFKSHV